MVKLEEEPGDEDMPILLLLRDKTEEFGEDLDPVSDRLRPDSS